MAAHDAMPPTKAETEMNETNYEVQVSTGKNPDWATQGFHADIDAARNDAANTRIWYREHGGKSGKVAQVRIVEVTRKVIA